MKVKQCRDDEKEKVCLPFHDVDLYCVDGRPTGGKVMVAPISNFSR